MRAGMDCALNALRGEPIRPGIASWEWQHAFQVAAEEKFCRISLRNFDKAALSFLNQSWIILRMPNGRRLETVFGGHPNKK